jgi:hypothetical protein
MTTVTRIRDWATGYTRLGRNDAVIVRHDNGRAVRFEFDSDDDYIYVYTYRWLSSGMIRESQDPVRAFRRNV